AKIRACAIIWSNRTRTPNRCTDLAISTTSTHVLRWSPERGQTRSGLTGRATAWAADRAGVPEQPISNYDDLQKQFNGPPLTRSRWRQSAGAGSVQPARRLEVSSFVIDLIRKGTNWAISGRGFFSPGGEPHSGRSGAGRGSGMVSDSTGPRPDA